MSRTASRIFSARSTPAALIDGSSSRRMVRCVSDFAQSANSSRRPAACRPPTIAPIDEPAMPTMSIAARPHRLDHPDVGVAAGAAAAECQRHPGRRRSRERDSSARHGHRSFCVAVRDPHRDRGGTFFTRDRNCAGSSKRSPGRYPHSSLAAASAAVITAACRASVSSAHRAFQLPRCQTATSEPSPDTARTATAPVLGWASIHTFAA